jgi:gamma-glutamylcyclotransferase
MPDTSRYYFAYGSNMDSRRMARRGLQVLSARAASLHGYTLRFNKRASNLPRHAYANVIPQSDGRVEGVLYELVDEAEIGKMDPFEGTPVRYRREVVSIHSLLGAVDAWVYIAQPAWIEEGLPPTRWYLDHLLAGALWLSPSWRTWLEAHPCDESQTCEPARIPPALPHALSKE